MSLNASQDGDVCSFCLDTFDNPRTLEWQVNCVQIMFSFFLNHFFLAPMIFVWNAQN